CRDRARARTGPSPAYGAAPRLDRRGIDGGLAPPLGLCRSADHPRVDDGGEQGFCRISTRRELREALDRLKGERGVPEPGPAEWLAYYSRKRIIHQWTQLHLLGTTDCNSVLEIGPALGLVTSLLVNIGYEVTTLDRA